jgi:hypothetical protein
MAPGCSSPPSASRSIVPIERLGLAYADGPVLALCRLEKEGVPSNALGGHFALERGKGQQHIEGKSPHGTGAVELLGERDQGDAARLERLHDFGEIGQRAGQPVDLVHHHSIELAGGDVGEQAFERRAREGCARRAAIVVGCLEHAPALVALAVDEGHARFALRAERVECRLEPRRLAGGVGSITRIGCHPGH